MGLAERRAVKEFQDQQFPNWQQKVQTAAGFEVPIEVKWDTLMIEDQAALCLECWPEVYFEPLVSALQQVTRDDLGREALRDGLKKIVVQNVADVYYGDRWAMFEAGVLTLDHLPTTNIGNQDERKDGVVTVLEKGL
jgi:hypothetical protein